MHGRGHATWWFPDWPDEIRRRCGCSRFRNSGRLAVSGRYAGSSIPERSTKARRYVRLCIPSGFDRLETASRRAGKQIILRGENDSTPCRQRPRRDHGHQRASGGPLPGKTYAGKSRRRRAQHAEVKENVPGVFSKSYSGRSPSKKVPRTSSCPISARKQLNDLSDEVLTN